MKWLTYFFEVILMFWYFLSKRRFGESSISNVATILWSSISIMWGLIIFHIIYHNMEYKIVSEFDIEGLIITLLSLVSYMIFLFTKKKELLLAKYEKKRAMVFSFAISYHVVCFFNNNMARIVDEK
ncbi:hypothetical protein R9C00_03130 [Flammeovirgaceae bacterium SG7u.111]|nr:hypothetical protein [Flammeovirgaceae bacterium SG7u.132]WPO36435.1 hypothetical protein R9C00_03130 [Flammeovirgaceae bacterium SG7u.111]